MLPLKKALRHIFYSVLAISFPAWLLYALYCHWTGQRLQDPSFTITAIVQTGPQKQALQTTHLAEILELCVDEPQNLYTFSLPEAEKKLRACPVIKEAKVERHPPNALHIDYSLRQPIALIFDYENTALDEENVLLPIIPFFTPKRLPELYLDLAPYASVGGGTWGKPLTGCKMELARRVLDFFASSATLESLRVLRIDVSQAFCESLGQQQIVVILEDITRQEEEWGLTTYLFPRLLRLATDHWQQGLQNSRLLRQELLEKELEAGKEAARGKTVVRLGGSLIDLRVKNVAYVKY